MILHSQLHSTIRKRCHRDQTNDIHIPLGLAEQLGRAHGILRPFRLIREESDDQDDADDERRQHVRRSPFVLIQSALYDFDLQTYLFSTPLHAHHEAQDTANTKKAANIIDLANDLAWG
jgi:hypothetical protein